MERARGGVRDEEEKEEPSSGSPRRMKAQCIPRLRNPYSSSCTVKSHRFTPSSLLERFREAVFRLIMLSALSSKASASSSSSSDHHQGSVRHRSYYPVMNEPHHSEAVADCIEFIKKKASNEHDNCCGGGGDGDGGPLDSSAEIVIPVPVM